MLHVLVGSNEDDFDAVVDAARKGKSVRGWVVPKNAVVGDRVLLFTRSHGFVADSRIASEKVPGEFGSKKVYRADVGPVTLFPTPVPLEHALRALPRWGWATYPRSYTTPAPSDAEALLAALDDFQRDPRLASTAPRSGSTPAADRQVVGRMNVYIANFGSGNWAWPECHRRGAIAVMDDMRVHPYWQRRDRDGYIETAMRALRTKKGQRPTPSVAARWYGANNVLHETAGDLWIHREKDELWWTVSTGEQPEMLVMDDPDVSFPKVKIAVYYKRCEAWSQRDKAGRLLQWAGIHPKAREFLFTEGTFQKLADDNAAFAQALIDGADLSRWCNLPEWQAKTEKSGKGAVRSFSPAEIAKIEEDRRMRQTAARMIKTAQQTALQSGQEVLSVTKDKRFLFPNDAAAQEYALELMKKQEGRCALTGLKMLLDDEPGDDQCRYSLDRIDSSKHYESGNLQVVCKFVNQWKGAMANEEFKRLIAMIRE